MSRRVQPDPINDNLAHDFYLYKDAGTVVSNWREQGYTHVLVFMPGKDSRFDEAFQQVLPFLNLQLEKQDYRLYSLIR